MAMVHGISQDHRVFDKQVGALRDSHRLILIDLPGHGLSADLSGPYGIPEFADAISGALEQAGIGRARFWGTHLGAASGLMLACKVPDLFEALIVEGTVFPGRAIPSVSAFLGRVASVAQQNGIEAAREIWWHEGGWFDVMRENPVICRAEQQREIIADFGGGPWLDPGLASKPIPPLDTALSNLTAPVLIMNGEHDLPDFLNAARALDEILPNSRRASIPGAGGFPLWEHSQPVNDVARAFLGALSG